MRLAVVLHNLGQVLRWFGAVLLLPLTVDLLYGNFVETIGFIIAALAAVLLGEAARRAPAADLEVRRAEGLAIVAAVWLVVALIGAVPYAWSGLSVVDAAFESMSGFTTTGATVFEDFSRYSHGLFFWRAFTQWLGGMGVIALFIAVLPTLAVAGRQLFFAEAPGPEEERLTPRIRHTAIALWSLYVGLTAAEVSLLWLFGMPLFDAVCNSFTTVAAGGFSPHPQSIAGYDNAAAEWVIVGFMFLAGANYSLQFRVLRGRPLSLLRDEEFRVYTALVLLAALLLGTTLYGFAAAPSPVYQERAPHGGVVAGASTETLARQSLFQVLTIVTTTGFASDDFDLWSDEVRVVLLLLMFVGGCAGSAAGGPKVVRVWLVVKFAGREVFKALHSQAVRPVRLGRRVVPPEVMQSILAFLLLYLAVFAASVVLLALLGADLMTGITASIATLGNIGPGFGAVGPMASYAQFHPLAKLVLFANMWIGRLEVITVLVFLQPQVWRAARWRGRTATSR